MNSLMKDSWEILFDQSFYMNKICSIVDCIYLFTYFMVNVSFIAVNIGDLQQVAFNLFKVNGQAFLQNKHIDGY